MLTDMKSLATLLTILAQLGLAGYSQAADGVPECSEKQLLGDVPTQSEQAAHRQFSTAVSKLDDSGRDFRGFAQGNHSARVIAWLDAH